MSWSNSPAFIRGCSRALFKFLRNGCAIVGLLVIGFFGFQTVDFFSPPVADAIAQVDSAEHTEAVDSAHFAAEAQSAQPSPLKEESAAEVIVAPPDPRERPLSRQLARVYKIAPEAASDFVRTSIEVGKLVSLDPILLLAVIAVESRFNPIAESSMGAKGLMQVMPQYHSDKLGFRGAEEAVLDPWLNIYVGAQILAEYVKRAGSVTDGLQWYNGSASDPVKLYAEKVFGERERLRQVLPKSIRADTRV